jgi:hypothetical protein
MPITTTHCPVSHLEAIRVTDFEDNTLRVICAEYDDVTGACGLKVRALAGGPLARLLDHAEEHTLAAHGVRCQVA